MAEFAYIRDLNPQKDDLTAILKIIRKHEGSNDDIAEQIKKLFERTGNRRGYTLHSIHANTITSLREDNLGIIDREAKLTPFGRDLLKVISSEVDFRASVDTQNRQLIDTSKPAIN